MNYAVGQIKGRQYIIKPGVTLAIDKIEGTKLSVDQILLMVDDGKIEIGHPYLDKKLDLEVVGQKKDKVRVFKYQPKANHHKTIGQKIEKTLVKLATK